MAGIVYLNLTEDSITLASFQTKGNFVNSRRYYDNYFDANYNAVFNKFILLNCLWVI